MKTLHWRHVLYAFLFSFLFGGLFALAGQEIVDTAFLEIRGNLTGVAIVRDFVETPSIGDTIIFKAVAVDEEGDTIDADFTWISGDTTALRLIQQPDGTARGIALRKATVWIAVRAEPITEVLLASFRDGRLNWSGYDTLTAINEEIQYCAYAVRGSWLVAESPGPPTCPTVFSPEPITGLFADLWHPIRVKPAEWFGLGL